MTTEKDTSRPGWKARTIFGIIGLATAISFFTMGSARTLIAGIALLCLALYHFVAAVRLRRELSTLTEENGRP